LTVGDGGGGGAAEVGGFLGGGGGLAGTGGSMGAASAARGRESDDIDRRVRDASPPSATSLLR
jgi:hypothetical protein